MAKTVTIMTPASATVAEKKRFLDFAMRSGARLTLQGNNVPTEVQVSSDKLAQFENQFGGLDEISPGEYVATYL